MPARLFAVAACLIVVGAATAGQAPGFLWLHPHVVPGGWKLARLPSGKATFGYPSTWRTIRTDPGTVSVALLDRERSIRGYLNLTPRQGTETLANWPRFRIEHQGDEGSTEIRLIASAHGLVFPSGRGSCVIDSYRTSRARYREIACLVAGTRSSSVIVGAAPSKTWTQQAATIERAIATLRTA